MTTDTSTDGSLPKKARIPDDLTGFTLYPAPSLVAVDFETTYQSGVRDIKCMGAWKYLAHPDTDIYFVAIYGRVDGEPFAWVGNPKDAPWARIHGAEWVSHNRTFDFACFQELVRRGVVNDGVDWAWWHCSSDLATYIQAPRSLDKVMKELFGVTLDKTARIEMDGKTWAQMTPEFRKAAARYALLDAKASYLIAAHFLSLMPIEEREASYHTTVMVARGMHVDRPAIDADEQSLQRTLADIEAEIPWANALDAKGRARPVSSTLALKEECRRLGIPAPTTTDTKSDEFDVWLAKYADAAPFVRAVNKWRSANRVAKLLRTFRERAFDDGRFPYGLKYGGAVHTLRWSGDAGLNMQNLSRNPIAGVDCRGKLVPAPGNVFVIADLAQIEARVSLWLVDDYSQLDPIAGGMDIYEAHARSTMNYRDPRPLKNVDPAMRQIAKCRVLALGFGLGSGKFKGIVKAWAGADITEEESTQIVADYRRANPRIVQAWRDLESAIKATPKGGTYTTELPSGRVIRYFDVREQSRGVQGRTVRGDYAKSLYGGLLFENVVQATARDFFRDAILRIESAGFPVVLHVHDEVVVEVEESRAEEAKQAVEALMPQTPEWAAGLPVACEATVATRYGK